MAKKKPAKGRKAASLPNTQPMPNGAMLEQIGPGAPGAVKIANAPKAPKPQTVRAQGTNPPKGATARAPKVSVRQARKGGSSRRSWGGRSW